MGAGAAVAFWVLAVVGVGSAVGVVLVKDIFRAALFLVVAFLSVAGLYILLQADFLAVAQVLIYAGAISILLIFAIMLTRDVQRGNPSNRLQALAFFLAALLLVAIVFVVLNTDWKLAAEQPLESTTAALADALFSDFVLPFEVASALLLAAVIGALVMIRER